MKAAALAGVSRRRRARTPLREDRLHPSADLADRAVDAARPNMLWVADIPYVPTWAGFLDLAVVLDAVSRRSAGWALGPQLKTRLVRDAVTMAIVQRTPSDVLHRSDQGAHDTSGACGLGGRAAGVRSSRGSVGDAYDTAMRESVFAILEGALPDRRTLSPKADARMAIFEVIEGRHTPRRRPSARGSLSPIDDERRALETLEPPGP